MANGKSNKTTPSGGTSRIEKGSKDVPPASYKPSSKPPQQPKTK